MLDNFKVQEQSETEVAITYTVKPTLTFTDKDLEDEATMAFFTMCGGSLPEPEVTETEVPSVDDTYFKS